MQKPCSEVLFPHPEPSRDTEVKTGPQAAATRRLSEIFSAAISYLISAPFQPQKNATKPSLYLSFLSVGNMLSKPPVPELRKW